MKNILIMKSVHLYIQGFSLMKDGTLRTTLHCVVAKMTKKGNVIPYLQNCFSKRPTKWSYTQVCYDTLILVNTSYNVYLAFCFILITNNQYDKLDKNGVVKS